jgi:5-methylthioadenosine/S-adenosylhomocysteine deaminase
MKSTSRPSDPLTPIDLLLNPEWMIPIDPPGVTLQNYSLAISEGRIIDLLPQEVALKRFKPLKVLDLPNQVLIPGFVNLHTHAAMSLFRGYADDLPLMKWLQEHIWPAENRHVSPEFVKAGTQLACAEMLRGGVTCFNDMYFFPEAAADAVREAGIRAALGMIVIEFPSMYASNVDDYIAKGLSARDNNSDNNLISFCFSPHSPYTVTNRSFERIGVLADQINVPIHLHIHETKVEIEDSIKTHGVRPLERLRSIGIVSPRMIGVHAVHLTADEIRMIGREGVHIAHCPTSNLKLGSGIAPMAAIEAARINFGLGTDGAASNNRLDPFHELRHAALLAKGASGNAAAMSTHSALHGATLGGAKALGLDRIIGSLTPGKSADLCAIRLDEWINQPCFDPASHLVFVAGREQVCHVWVAGKQQVLNGELVNFDLLSLIKNTKIWHTRIKS